MKVIPAIDLIDNKAVRLYQGSYEKTTIYSDSPWEWVDEFQKQGVVLVHLVDLEGARTGIPGNSLAIRKIRETFRSDLQLGGGIRSLNTLAYYADLGIQRFVLGTRAIQDTQFLEKALAMYGKERIAVSVDVRDGYVKTQGWEKDSGMRYEECLSQLEAIGISYVVCTDISKDGTLGGPNLGIYKWILKQFDFHLIASGGISSLEDIRNLRSLENGKMYGVITGKAVYERRLSLASAIEYCNQSEVHHG